MIKINKIWNISSDKSDALLGEGDTVICTTTHGAKIKGVLHNVKGQNVKLRISNSGYVSINAKDIDCMAIDTPAITPFDNKGVDGQ